MFLCPPPLCRITNMHKHEWEIAKDTNWSIHFSTKLSGGEKEREETERDTLLEIKKQAAKGGLNGVLYSWIQFYSDETHEKTAGSKEDDCCGTKMTVVGLREKKKKKVKKGFKNKWRIIRKKSYINVTSASKCVWWWFYGFCFAICVRKSNLFEQAVVRY